MVDLQIQTLQHLQNPARLLFTQKPLFSGINRIQGKPDRHGFRVRQLIIRERFQLVSGPVAEIQRPARAGLKRVPAHRDMRGVQQRGALHAFLKNLPLLPRESAYVLLNPFEEPPVLDQRHFHRLDQACDARLVVLTLQKPEVVDHRKGHRKRSDPVLFPEGVDRTFHAHSAVIL